jgi:hypothetical protein
VNFSIYLNYKQRSMAIKIYNVLPNVVLTAKLCIEQAAIAQTFP